MDFWSINILDSKNVSSFILFFIYIGLMKVNLDCEDFIPLEEDQYKIIHLKESDSILEKIPDENNFYRDLPELKHNNVLKRITLNFTYISDINSAYLKEETIFKDIEVKNKYLINYKI